MLAPRTRWLNKCSDAHYVEYCIGELSVRTVCSIWIRTSAVKSVFACSFSPYIAPVTLRASLCLFLVISVHARVAALCVICNGIVHIPFLVGAPRTAACRHDDVVGGLVVDFVLGRPRHRWFTFRGQLGHTAVDVVQVYVPRHCRHRLEQSTAIDHILPPLLAFNFLAYHNQQRHATSRK